MLAHRLAYEMHVGPIPEGMDIDHTCGRRECIEPSHLRPLTPLENRGQANRGRAKTDSERAKIAEGVRRHYAD